MHLSLEFYRIGCLGEAFKPGSSVVRGDLKFHVPTAQHRVPIGLMVQRRTTQESCQERLLFVHGLGQVFGKQIA